MKGKPVNLYILKPTHPNTGAWYPWYDKMFGFVVAAISPDRARELADADAGDENRNGKHVWLDPEQTTCVELRAQNYSNEVVMCDFSAA